MRRSIAALLSGCLLAVGLTAAAAPASATPAPAASTLSVQSSTVSQGTDLVADYTTDRPDDQNWIGLYTDPGNGPVNQKYVGPSLKWKYTPGASGQVRFGTADLDPGRYILYFLYNDGYTWLADPVGFDIVTGAASSFVLPAFSLKPARAGEAYAQSIAGTVRPARTDLTFRKTSGPTWASVSATGTVSGTPSATDAGGTASVGVEAVDGDGRRTTTTVGIPVRAATQPLVGDLKVMSYNLWFGGTRSKDYRTKQLRFLLSQNVDVVGFQESYSTSARELADLLGWHHYQASYSLGIISRYPITATDSSSTNGTMYGAGARIRLDAKYPQDIVLWTAHLHYTPYGPYDACHSQMTVEQILRREEQSGRPRQIAGILKKLAPDVGKAATTPVFLVGDFNTPSHLDWTAVTKDTHCGYEIAWPTTVKVADAGLTDSYRAARPDPLGDPGNTWSPIYPEDPQDRIDFVTYAGRLQVLDSTALTVGVVDPNDPANNEWTSDHRAVMTTFHIG
ncbi:MAG: endonuclease/exonuclease/phosphatase family protein [Micromonosporaceae bacterium]